MSLRIEDRFEQGINPLWEVAEVGNGRPGIRHLEPAVFLASMKSPVRNRSRRILGTAASR